MFLAYAQKDPGTALDLTLVVEAATTFLADFIRNFLSSLLVHAHIHLISITDNFIVKRLEVVVRIGGNCSVAALKKIFRNTTRS